MAPGNDTAGLAAAWRALAGAGDNEGWRIVPLMARGAISVLAGRRKPDDLEALLLGFRYARLPRGSRLPAGRGFAVEVIRHPAFPAGTLLALTRQRGAGLDLFEMMAGDLVTSVQRVAGEDEQAGADTVIARIAAWQDFMQRDRGGILGEEEEIGLHGELVVLEQIMAGSTDVRSAVEMWKGPLDGLHDFVLPEGAIETKASTASTGFRANIASFDQLDLAIRSPLYVAAVRFSPGEGMSLPERIDCIRAQTTARSPTVLQELNLLLVRAGYADALAERYTRRLRLVELRLFEVTDVFPALTARLVPRGVVAARYVVDLDSLPLPTTSLPRILQTAGLP